MGNEATCFCDCNGERAQVKALIEPPVLILRGAMRRKIAIAEMKQVRAEKGRLQFSFDGQVIALELGDALAKRWVEKLLMPPPSLAKKLGITAETNVRMIGKTDDEALQAAISEAKKVSNRSGDLILARVDTLDDLNRALTRSADALRQGAPIWLIYRKGPGHELNESKVRSTALAAGIVDTKVAAISPALTGLRFVKRKS